MITNCFDRVKIFRRVRYFRMKITKFGHCCLSVEERGVRILVDPGNYTSGQNEAKGIHIVLITHHEHRDHLDMESLKRVLKNVKWCQALKCEFRLLSWVWQRWASIRKDSLESG